MKNTLLFLSTFLLFQSLHSAITKSSHTLASLPARKTSDSIELLNTSFYTAETTEMRDFLLKMNGKIRPDEESYRIQTTVNSDSSFTTGNMDKLEKIDDILPNYDMPYVDEEAAEGAREHFLRVEKLINTFNLDLYSEDPRIFLGDTESYFKIIRKRGLLFFYFSRILLYGAVVLLIFGYFLKKNAPDESVNSDETKRRYNSCRAIQWVSMGTILLLSIGTFFYLSVPKEKLDNSAATLLFGFRTINSTVHNIIDEIESINAMKLVIPKRGIFGLSNVLKFSHEKVEEDVHAAENFSENMLKNPSLTNYSFTFSLIFLLLILIGIAFASQHTKNSNFQIGIFLLTALTLSYTVYNMGQFFSNYSTLHDICKSILHYSGKDIPETGIGLVNFVGCTEENSFYQQLVLTMKAQNAALKLFNYEMTKIGRPPVNSKEEALHAITYMMKIDESNSNINNYSSLIKRLDKTLLDLLSISKCNIIRHWVSTAESEVCYSSSKKLLNTFVVYFGILCFLLICLGSSLFLADAMSKMELIKFLKKQKFTNERFNNDMVLE